MIKIERPECPRPAALAGGDYKERTNKEALRMASFDKCMYCESKISHIDYAHVEHIKPKAQFPELKFRWDNLGYACPKCNIVKGEKYVEDTPYVDPYSEEPENHVFACGAFIFARNGSERGELTIVDVDLNRNDLILKRQAKIEEMVKAVTACFRTNNEKLRNNALNEIRRETYADKEYSLVVRAVVAAAAG